MKDKPIPLVGDLPGTSAEGYSRDYGHGIWKWTESGWAVENDFSTAKGDLQSPVVQGEFIGQLKAVVCKPKAEEIAN